MADMLTRNGITLLKIQSAEGTPATPTVSADAIEAEGPPQIGPAQETATTNEETSSLDVRPPIPARARGNATFTVPWKHSGTAATAPDVGASLRCCAMAETIVSAVTDTGQAGGSTTVAKLHAAASATDHAYTGMLYTCTGGTNNGFVGRIVSYNGTTKNATLDHAAGSAFDATSTFTIATGVQYKTISNITEYATIWHYKRDTAGGNSVLNKVTDALGRWDLTVPVGDVARLAFTFAGRAVAPSDVADPGTATYDTTRPNTFQGATAYMNSVAVKPTTLSLTNGVTAEPANDATDAFGYGSAFIPQRAVTGSIQLPQTLVANRDFWTLARNGTQMPLAVSWGPSAGRRVTLVIPAIVFNSRADVDDRGSRHETIEFGAFGDNITAFLVFD